MNIKIRYAIYEDYLEILKLLEELHKIHFEARPDVYKSGYDLLSEEEYTSELNNNSIKRIVIVKSNEIIAYLLARIIAVEESSVTRASKYIYIDEAYVSCNYRRNGIGKMLFNKIMEIANDEECKSIQLNVWAFNNDAISFYEKLGLSTRNIRLECEVK